MMRELSLKELKSYQIGILDAVSEYCDEHGINYFLTGGTLLGAVRHKGYIPWDDDIDICMMRSEYNKFASEFNKQNKRYKLYQREYGKVLDTHTILYEPDITGNKICVNIDLFIMDVAPESSEEVNAMYNRRDRIRKKIILRELSKKQQITGLHSFWYYIKGVFSRIIPRKLYERKLSINAQKYAKRATNNVGDFCGFYYGQPRVCVNKDIFADFVELMFEEKKYKAPVGYDEWLTALYGNYKQLPPEEERVSHHRFKAYSCD